MVLFDTGDEENLIRNYMSENKITLPVVVDSSSKYRLLCGNAYMVSGVPCNYLIDGDGKVILAWYGGQEQGLEKLKSLGLAADKP
ncbi:MAG: hypothetical protein WC712_11145 [Candidatus Brocadiia bacterium]